MGGLDYSKYFSSPKETALVRAIMDGDENSVRGLVAEGVNVNAVGEYENTPLRVAIKSRQKKIVQLLLQLGGDPNFKTPKGAAAADVAVIEKDPDYLRLFLNFGLDPNLRSGDVPLIFYAISENNWPHYEMLLAKGADINSKNADGSTILMDLVMQLEYDRAKELLLSGADFRAVNQTGLSVPENLVECQRRFCSDPNLPDCRKRAELLKLMQNRGLAVPTDLQGMGT
ncbi:ankyrin repeat domain-containing protein [Geomonas sp. RF6]|uniref:ankyrin repeat domain-containing protein n=1 Tax=Geomonas sp. RF6 TaxID=2897342 RepID=UPI001E4F4453|nr:ankyrin repeat domain-containing protein [Geomonas sp. RF6]UFS70704.1 ankyrin repeat domain-containing protein [Geomonas sp. RF6]